jgi:hypothetical protein
MNTLASTNRLDRPDGSFDSALSATQQPVATAALASQDAISAALQAVVQFLQLRPDQETVRAQLLQARQETLPPILQAIAQRESQWYQLLESRYSRTSSEGGRAC